MSADAASPPRVGSGEPAAGVPFSLFDDDWFRRAWASLGLGSHARFRMVKRCGLAMFVCYVPMAVLAWRQGLVGSSDRRLERRRGASGPHAGRGG